MTKQEKIERYVQIGGKWRKVDRVPDMVEVVRCKDCKHLCENDGYYFCNAIGIAFGDKSNWFCADGEREEQNDDTRESNRNIKSKL